MSLDISAEDIDRPNIFADQGVHDGTEICRSHENYNLISLFGHTFFSKQIKDKIVYDLSLGLPDFDVEEYFGTQPTVFSDYDFLVTAADKRSGSVIGLIGARWMYPAGRRILYLWTAMLADAYRSTPLYTRMKAFMMSTIMMQNEQSLPEFVVTKTYNPRVFALLRKYFERVPGTAIYPRIPGAQDPKTKALCESIASSLWPAMSFDPDTGVLKGGQAAVAPNFFPRMEFCRDGAVNTHFARHLTRDDQIVCVVQIPKSSSSIISNKLNRMPFLSSPKLQ